MVGKDRYISLLMKKNTKRRLAFGGLTLLFFIFCVALGWVLRRDESPVQALVEVEHWSGYALPLEGGDTLYFAELTPWDREVQQQDSVRLLRGLHTEREPALLHRVTQGFRIDVAGRVQCALRPSVESWQGDTLRAALRATERATRARVALMKRQRSELAYYRRTHSIVDDGYHEVMRFATKLHLRLKNEQTCLLLLQKALKQQNLRAIVYQGWQVDGVEYVSDGTRMGLLQLLPRHSSAQRLPMKGESLFAVLRGQAHSFWPHINSAELNLLQQGGAGLGKGAHISSPNFQLRHRDGLWQHTDSTGTHFRLQRRDSLWEGTAVTAKGLYYQGTFDDSLRRHGFGFGIGHRLVKCGIWEHGRFHGERMVYHGQRIFGIDISRYQHEQGKKVYPILWDSLRITHLGTISKKRVRGTVNYPVRFLFIKATQGISITSRYYRPDLRAARARGIPVAPYHFFSPTPNGGAQALHFLRHAQLSQTTLPPMLDVEPTVAEIARMGGIEVLYREMREWLTLVERVGGRRPVLYLPQYFINRYMDTAPDWLRSYDVWIARYGDYKPYVRLLLWQLSPDGRVRGIRGEVDINVFNGTEPDFRRWVEGR